MVSGKSLYDAYQRHIGSIGIYLDVTPQRHLETNLREAKVQAESSSRAKQEFLANVSHGIRTPMNAILGMSQLLGRTPLAASQDSYLHAITASAGDLLVIINDVLDLPKIEAARMAVETISFSPSQVCAQVERTLLYKAEEKGLSFVTHIGSGVPPLLLGDPYRITQILLNLAGNAVKLSDKGVVKVLCKLLEAPADEIGVVVIEFALQDAGIGIEAGYLATMFDDLSQDDSSVTPQFGARAWV